MTRLAEDRALLEAFRRGDRAALEEVYREYSRPLYSFFAAGFAIDSGGKVFLFKGFAERWAADDAVQEVFVRAFAPGARQSYDGLRPYRNFLFTIGRNYVIDRWRARCREIELVEQDVAPTDPSSPASKPADERVGTEQLKARCDAFLATLDETERGLFEARFHLGLSIEETARRLGTTEHAVKRIERIIKKRFFIQLKEHGYFEGYRYGRRGIERLGALLSLLAGAAA